MSKLLSTEQSINIILDPDLQAEFVCKYVPISVNRNSVFLVDMNHLSDPRDIMCDDMGSWKWGGSYRMWLEVDDIGDVKVLGKEIPQQEKDDLPCFRIWKRYYNNKSSPDVKKLVVTVEGILVWRLSILMSMNKSLFFPQMEICTLTTLELFSICFLVKSMM